MMNTLLNVADTSLQYFRGKQTGLWGLVGIFLFYLTYRLWEQIQPAFEVLGVVTLLDSLGLIVKDGSELTAYKIFLASIFGCFLFAIAFGILMAIVSSVLIITQNEFGQKLMRVSLLIIFSPFVLLYGLTMGYKKTLELKEKKRDPEAFFEKKRQEKDRDIIDYLLKAGVEDHNNVKRYRRRKELDNLKETSWDAYFEQSEIPITEKEDNLVLFEKAVKDLNRLPTVGDKGYFLGVTFDREFYFLLPRPVSSSLSNGSDHFIGDKIYLKGEKYRDKSAINNKVINKFRVNGKFERNVFYRSGETPVSYDGLSEIPHSDIEFIIDMNEIEELETIMNNYRRTFSYETYVKNEQDNYFNRKEYLKKMISSAETKEEFDSYVDQITKYNA